MKIGCLNKNTNITEYTYFYTRFKALSNEYGQEPYVQYEIQDGTITEQYIWDESSQTVILNPNYQAPAPDYVKQGMNIVTQAISFGQHLMIKFAGENVAMGITQAGKTREVADFLEGILKYIQSGSLYEVIVEIDLIISNGIPVGLSPFVTEERLLQFKQDIIDYLT